jgi:hypothetical protein
VAQSGVLEGCDRDGETGNTARELTCEATAQSEWYWSERLGRARPREPGRRAARLARKEIMLLREWHNRAPDPAYLQRIVELERWIASLERQIDP